MTSTDGRYFRVSPKFWADPMVLAWGDDARLLALYLLTCEHRTTEGLFRLPRLYGCADLGWSKERYDEGLQRLVDDGFVEWDEQAQVVLIVKALAWQSPDNPNQVKSAVKLLAQLPPTHLTCSFRRLAERFAERLAEGLPEGFGRGLPDPPSPSPAPPPTPETPSSTDVDTTDDQDDEVEEQFEKFWDVWPKRNGKKIGKGDALAKWKRLTLPQRRAAYIGARNYAAACVDPNVRGVGAQDAFRWLEKRRWVDWQQPAVPDGTPTPPADRHDATPWLEETR